MTWFCCPAPSFRLDRYPAGDLLYREHRCQIATAHSATAVDDHLEEGRIVFAAVISEEEAIVPRMFGSVVGLVKVASTIKSSRETSPYSVFDEIFVGLVLEFAVQRAEVVIAGGWGESRRGSWARCRCRCWGGRRRGGLEGVQLFLDGGGGYGESDVIHRPSALGFFLAEGVDA